MNAQTSGRGWRITGYTAAAIAAAGLTYLTRRSLDHPGSQATAHITPVAISPAASQGEGGAVDPATLDGPALARFMDLHPAEMMDLIDRLQDRDLALKWTGELVAESQGPHFDLLAGWAKRQKDEAITAGILTGMAARWVREDPQGCIALACELGKSAAAEKGKETVFLTLTAEQSLEMLDRLPAEERAGLLNRQPERLAASNPEAALTEIDALPASSDRTQAMEKLLKIWVSGSTGDHPSDPEAAMQHVMAIEDETLRHEGLMLAAKLRYQMDAGAGNWFGSLPLQIEDREDILETCIRQLAEKNRQAAFGQVEEIWNDDLKQRVVSKLNSTSERGPLH